MMEQRDHTWFSWLMFLMFVHLKLQGSIDCSWWLVFAPIYVNVILQIVVTAVGRHR